MKYNAQGQEVADDDPTAVSDTPPAPPANNPPAPPSTPPVDHAGVMAAYEAQLLQTARENSELRRQLESRTNAPPAPLTPDQERAFFDNPRTATAEIVRAELDKQVAPINQFVQQMQRDTLVGNFKNQMRALPQFKHLGKVENIFDQLMRGASVVDQNTIITAYHAAVGHYVSQGGMLEDAPPAPPVNNNPPTNNNPPVPPNPPRVPPSPPAPPARNNGGKPKRQLNENEKKIARFRGMTDDEYIMWTDDVKPNEVAHLTDDQIKERLNK